MKHVKFCGEFQQNHYNANLVLGLVFRIIGLGHSEINLEYHFIS